MLNSLNNPHTQLRDRLGEVQAWLGEKAEALLVMGRGAHNDFGPENNDAAQRNNEGDNHVSTHYLRGMRKDHLEGLRQAHRLGEGTSAPGSVVR